MSLMDLSDQMDIVRQHQVAPPVKVVTIAHGLGLKVYKLPAMPSDLSGMIKREGDDSYAIYVNGQHPNVRQRFTIAHEIAHFMLHRSLIGDGIVDDPQYRSGLSTQVEAQVNRLAAGILMPMHLIQPRLSAGRSLEQLAEEFEVSKDAMSIRILGVPYKHSQEAA